MKKSGFLSLLSDEALEAGDQIPKLSLRMCRSGQKNLGNKGRNRWIEEKIKV